LGISAEVEILKRNLGKNCGGVRGQGDRSCYENGSPRNIVCEVKPIGIGWRPITKTGLWSKNADFCPTHRKEGFDRETRGLGRIKKCRRATQKEKEANDPLRLGKKKRANLTGGGG